MMGLKEYKQYAKKIHPDIVAENEKYIAEVSLPFDDGLISKIIS